MKSVKQISIFVENTAGRMAHILKCLAENKIDIKALSIADTITYLYFYKRRELLF